MAKNQWDYDNAMPEDYEIPERAEPELAPDQDAVEQMMYQEQISGMRAVTWDNLVRRVKDHPEFPDALGQLARGDCSPLRELTKETALTMVRQYTEKGIKP